MMLSLRIDMKTVYLALFLSCPIITAGSGITALEEEHIRYIREEEKLARDVYLVLYERWDEGIFLTISQSEQRHMDAVAQLIEKYALTDPVLDDSIGQFTNPEIGALYTTLVENGSQSLLEALQVGVQIEEMDIADITETLEDVEKGDIRKVFENLLQGSLSHLRGFTNAIAALTDPQQTIDPIQVSPNQIVLNAQGQQEDILVIIRKSMASGYEITDFALTLYFNEIEVAQAYALRYCYIDDNFLASFDWDTILNNPAVVAMAGSEVIARLDGWYTAQNGEGETLQDTLAGQDLVQIMDPDWEMTITKSDTYPDGEDVLLGFDTDQQASQNLLLWDRGQGAETSYGQTFRFDRPIRLDKITLKIKTTDIDISEEPVELWFGRGFHDVTDSRLSSLIVTPSANLPVAMGMEEVWYLTFDFENQYLLADTDYGFMLRFAGGGSGQGGGLEANVFAMGQYSYDDGAAFIYSGNWSGTVLNNELVFFLHGQEITVSPLLGDSNIDFTVNLLDQAILSNYWLAEYNPVCCGPDVNCDGLVDLGDLYYIVQNWLETL
ncbi:MAG: DUF2202 domain-containing protein [Sedimentisphaerales bacterium]|nr:DUF2202 domain-containing protein [Sedimentisphaerales bacterium]